MGDALPVAVLGGSGYVAGELLRLLAGHPRFRLAGAFSSSQPGERVVDCFPHLRGLLDDTLAFAPPAALAAHLPAGTTLGLFAATPHGTTAPLLAAALHAAADAGAELRVVDLSADFRYPTAPEFEAVYGAPHGAAALLPDFVCAVPEHGPSRPPRHAAQPGCFTTAVTLAAYPFLALGLVEPEVVAVGVTGSSGSGRTPTAATHHPERHATLRAYGVLAHRHEPEMRRLLAAAAGGREPEVEFVPCSGPFVRGIHATLRLRLGEPASAAALVAQVNAFYAASPFVHASVAPPALTEVVGTNRCRLGVAARGRTLVVTSVIDNLVKGAAGGAVQWMNRLFGLADDAGLALAGLGWY